MKLNLISGNLLCLFVFNHKSVDLKPSFANILKCLSVYDTALLVSLTHFPTELKQCRKFHQRSDIYFLKAKRLYIQEDLNDRQMSNQIILVFGVISRQSWETLRHVSGHGLCVHVYSEGEISLLLLKCMSSIELKMI